MAMPRGDKSKYTDKQKRQAEHIEEGYEERGVSEEEAERRAWETVDKMTGGGKKSGSGRGEPVNKVPARKGSGSAVPPQPRGRRLLGRPRRRKHLRRERAADTRVLEEPATSARVHNREFASRGCAATNLSVSSARRLQPRTLFRGEGRDAFLLWAPAFAGVTGPLGV